MRKKRDTNKIIYLTFVLLTSGLWVCVLGAVLMRIFGEGR